jgi:hypothetical protein
MKTSRKILIVLAAFLIVLWTALLFMVRGDIDSLLSQRNVIIYTDVPVEKFRSIELSSNWVVSIRSGRKCKIEIEDRAGVHPDLKYSNGTVRLESQQTVHAKITAPSLDVISAEGNTRIEMKNFWSDSLTVVLADSSTYTGSKNDFDYVSFKVGKNDD